MKKKVLVVGGGGREHAIVDALSRSAQVGKIYCAPGNAGIAEQAECVPLKDTDVDGLLRFAQEHTVDLTVVGPEAALAAGIVDRFRAAGLRIFGHTQAATAIESSKEFAKQLMVRAGVPTAAFRTFTAFGEALSYVHSGTFPTVIKYDGLAAGKGVVVAATLDEAEAALRDMLLDGRYGEGKVVIEEFLTGPEFSLMAFVSGRQVCPMVCAQDHKRAFDGDAGPNTGGMGAYTESFAAGRSGLSFISDNDYAFAGGQAVVFEHGGERTGRYIGERLLIVREAAVAGGGDAVLLHEFLGKLLGALDGGSGLRVAEDLEPGGAEGIHDACGQRCLGAHDGEVHAVLYGKSLETFHVGVLDGHVECLAADTGIAGGAVDFAYLRAAGESIHNGMLPSAAADDQDGFSKQVLQLDFLTLDRLVL